MSDKTDEPLFATGLKRLTYLDFMQKSVNLDVGGNILLFPYEKIRSLNESELIVYNYVAAHMADAAHMNIRELSKAAGVSTTTILRFCEKLDCNGYTEFKFRLNQNKDRAEVSNVHAKAPLAAIQFLQSVINNPGLDEKMDQAARMCLESTQIFLIGNGTSGSMAEYGSRFLANVGISALPIKDPFYPPPAQDMSHALLIAFSVSGETPDVISLCNGYKQKCARIISITNTAKSTLARMSDLNFSYYMPLEYIYSPVRELNLTTSIPVCYLIETLAKKIHDKTKTPITTQH